MLERNHSTWGRAQVVEALSVVLPTRHTKTAEALRHAADLIADLILDHGDVVRLTFPNRPGTDMAPSATAPAGRSGPSRPSLTPSRGARRRGGHRCHLPDPGRGWTG